MREGADARGLRGRAEALRRRSSARSRRSRPCTTSARSRSRRRRSSTRSRARRRRRGSRSLRQNLHEQAQDRARRGHRRMETQRNLKREIATSTTCAPRWATCAEVREKERHDRAAFGPVEEMYAMLNRYEVRCVQGGARHGRRAAVHVEEAQDARRLRHRQPESRRAVEFKQGPRAQRQAFVADVAQFRNEFEANGPDVPGITPMQANERLQALQARVRRSASASGTSTRRARTSSACR